MPSGVYERTPEQCATISATQRGSNGKRWNYEGFVVKRGRVFVRIVFGWQRRARVVWVQHNGPIAPGYLIHHEDENKMNDVIDNLRCWTRQEHARHHLSLRQRTKDRRMI